MKRLILVAVAVLGVWACGESAGDAQTATDTLTRRQKDSLLSTVPFPGASKIGDAQKAADRLNERTRQIDSIN